MPFIEICRSPVVASVRTPPRMSDRMAFVATSSNSATPVPVEKSTAEAPDVVSARMRWTATMAQEPKPMPWDFR